MNDKYILDGHTPVPTDLMTWARWYEKAERHVGNDHIGEVHVSTVFLGLDHSFGEGPPQLFETMIFGGPHSDYQERCSTWEEAEAMHQRALAMVRAGLTVEAQ